MTILTGKPIKSDGSPFDPSVPMTQGNAWVGGVNPHTPLTVIATVAGGPASGAAVELQSTEYWEAITASLYRYGRGQP